MVSYSLLSYFGDIVFSDVYGRNFHFYIFVFFTQILSKSKYEEERFEALIPFDLSYCYNLKLYKKYYHFLFRLSYKIYSFS